MSEYLSDEALQRDYGWSDTACRIFRDKYLRKAGVPSRLVVRPGRDIHDPLAPSTGTPHATLGAEESIDQALQRLAGAWAYWLRKYGYLGTADAVAMRELLLGDLRHRRAFPNSPQWFNTGLWWAYGIEQEGGFSIEGEPAGPEEAQIHACFIQSLEDSLTGDRGIADLIARQAAVFKGGSGTGTNFSTLRGKGEPLTVGGTSSGLVSFLAPFDAGAGAIKSGGATRRSASMVVVDGDHPEILDVVRLKARGEDEALAMAVGSAALRATGRGRFLPEIGLAWNAQESAYGYARGQNANFSVRLDGARFWGAVDAKAPWTLYPRTPGVEPSEIPATDLAEAIADAAWYSADPGVQWDDLIQEWHTSPSMGRINASNPCSEYLYADDTACNLASLRLTAFFGADGAIDWAGMARCAKRWALVLDLSVSAARYPTRRIAERTAQSRTLGLGPMDLGGLLIRMGLRYSSAEGRQVAARCTATIHGAAGCSSQEWARDLGPCAAWEVDRAQFARVWRKHAAALEGIRGEDGWEPPMWPDPEGPFRNAQWTVCAPTGTIGLASGCDSTGIEPIYSERVTKSLAGGGSIELAAECVQACPDPRAVESASGPRALGWSAHLQMVAALQPFVSGGISKTLNLPSSTTPGAILAIYRRAWELGVKCVSVYRDGSKHSQVLGQGSADPVADVLGALRAPKRRPVPGYQTAERWSARVAGEAAYLTLARDAEGRPTQVRLEHGSAGTREACYAEALSKVASVALQYGVPLDVLAETLTDVAGSPAGPVSGGSGRVRFAGSVPAWAGRELLGGASAEAPPPAERDDGAVEGCPKCGGDLVQTGTCKMCAACGHSLGGCG